MGMKRNFTITVILYIVGLILGISVGELINLNLEKIDSTPNPDRLGTTFFIMKRNLIVFIILLSGIILFKIPTIINLIFNGSILGFMLSGIPEKELFVNIIAILIHGIPELIGFFIAAAIAFNGYEDFVNNKRRGFKILLFGITLIVLAAFLETFISPIVFTS